MDEELFEVGLEARKRVLGDEYVERAFANADSFNLEFQKLVTEYCWGEVWGRHHAHRSPAQPQQPLPSRRPESARGVQDALSGRAPQRVHARRATRHPDPDHDLRRDPGRGRGLPARTPSARGRGHHAGARLVTPSVVGFVGLGNMGHPMASRIAAAGFELVAFDAAGTTERIPAGAYGSARRRGPRGASRHDPAERARRRVHRRDRRRCRRGAQLAGSPRWLTSRPSARGPPPMPLEILAPLGVTYVDGPVSGGVAGRPSGHGVAHVRGSALGARRSPRAVRRLRTRVPRRHRAPAKGRR